jgi:hypothetical protein
MARRRPPSPPTLLPQETAERVVERHVGHVSHVPGLSGLNLPPCWKPPDRHPERSEGPRRERRRFFASLRMTTSCQPVLPGHGGDLPQAADDAAGGRAQGLPVFAENLAITRPDQVWSTDITYVPMRRGFLYLVAVMDWFRRYVLSRRLSNTLDGGFCLEALDESLRLGKPEIFNSDQGSQFTAAAFTGRLESAGVAISMDNFAPFPSYTLPGRSRSLRNPRIREGSARRRFRGREIARRRGGSPARRLTPNSVGHSIVIHQRRLRQEPSVRGAPADSGRT